MGTFIEENKGLFAGFGIIGGVFLVCKVMGSRMEVKVGDEMPVDKEVVNDKLVDGKVEDIKPDDKKDCDTHYRGEGFIFLTKY